MRKKPRKARKPRRTKVIAKTYRSPKPKLAKRAKFIQYKPTTSKIEKEFGAFLTELGYKIQKQFQVAYKFYDFKIKDTKVLIELDGDYWHCNPEKFPDGPKTNIQKENRLNDVFKNGLAESYGYKLLRVWENDYRNNKGTVIKQIRAFINKNK